MLALAYIFMEELTSRPSQTQNHSTWTVWLVGSCSSILLSCLDCRSTELIRSTGVCHCFLSLVSANSLTYKPFEVLPGGLVPCPRFCSVQFNRTKNACFFVEYELALKTV